MTDHHGYDLYWGDFHKHMIMDHLEEVVTSAKEHLDIYPVLCYPAEWIRKGKDFEGKRVGVREETTGNRPKFLEWWDQVNDTTRTHREPGEFVTFPAYEWHGNRTRWGDRCVFYFDEGNPLDDAWDVRDLYENLRERRALVIPHHTGYRSGNRGQDWDVFDSDLSPVAEIYSGHGSSEDVASPVPMEQNASMGPRTSGGTYVDALNRGYRIGVIASNDGWGLPGHWDNGLAGVWAEELTREAVWEALKARRTYGVTGDRIELWWELNGEPLGSVVDSVTDPTAEVGVECPQPLDRVELLRNGSVVDVYSHQDKWTRSDSLPEFCNLLVEFGWGPSQQYGEFEDTEISWEGSVSVEGAQLQSVTPRFTRLEQRYSVEDDQSCRIDFITDRDHGSNSHIQGLILQIEVQDDEPELVIDLEDSERRSVNLSEVRTRSHLWVRKDIAVGQINDTFDLAEADVENPDLYYSNSPKIKVSPVFPRRACTAEVSFDELAAETGDYYYVRASQVNGQYAWASPIWIK